MIAIPLLGIYPKECKPEHNRATCIPIFMATLLIITTIWKPPRYPTTKNGVRKGDI
jgi:hypothetical protein